jgi:DNA-binding IclR family transcriptional regulator
VFKPTENVDAELTPTQADILDALRDSAAELNTKKLAARAGYKPHAHFRRVLRTLLARRLIERGPDGYRLPPC